MPRLAPASGTAFRTAARRSGAIDLAIVVAFIAWGVTAGVRAPFLILLVLRWFLRMNSDGTGYRAQRTMACRSGRDGSPRDAGAS